VPFSISAVNFSPYETTPNLQVKQWKLTRIELQHPRRARRRKDYAWLISRIEGYADKMQMYLSLIPAHIAVPAAVETSARRIFS
jgi:hypothetical protein